MRAIGRFLGFLFATGAIIFLIGAAAAAIVIFKFEQGLPDYTHLKNYEPPVMTRVHAADGSLLAEYSHERRLYLPSSAIPDLVKHAFISAEDKNFYSHRGVDPEGIVRAAHRVPRRAAATSRAPRPSPSRSPRTFCSSSDRTVERKIREILLSLRIESAYSKDKILELYLNEIYLGLGNYGVAAAALNYFNKSVHELTDRRGRLSGRAAEGAVRAQPVPQSRPRRRAPQLRHRPHGGGRLHHRRAGRTRRAPSRSSSIRAC